MRYTILTFLLFFFAFSLFAKTISPLNYGLQQAKTGEERFRVLYQTHYIAKKNSWEVSYKGIKEIKIEIPSDAKSILLGNITNFNNVVITVSNTKKDKFYLFELSQELHSVTVTKAMLDAYDFKHVEELRHGYKLLVIDDKNPWVENREGYDYGAKRKDILLLKNGISTNETIAPYNNDSSKPSCSYVEATLDQKLISNVTLNRTEESTAKTCLVKVMNMNNVLVQGITINTPNPHDLYGDSAIGIYNCTNISVKNVSFHQTYSLSNKFGYGIFMNNVWNSWFDGINCEAKWGIFGNYNINLAHVSNSKINRFDTHCYGKDCYLSNCDITQFGIAESSFMGEIVFSQCTFKKAFVCLARTDYNAFTPFRIILKECNIYLDKHHTNLINLGNINPKTNKRKELGQKCSPSLHIINTKIYLSDDLSNWALCRLGAESGDSPFDVIGDIKVDGLKVIGKNANLMVFNRPIKCRNSVSIDIKGADLIQSESDFSVVARKKNHYTPTILFNVNKYGNDIYYISSSKLNYSPVEFPNYNVHFRNCILGRIRYYDSKPGEAAKRRKFDNCTIYLNDIDTENYTLDENADYKRCIFKPVNKTKKVVPMTKNKSSVMTFEDCSSDVTDLFGPKLPKSKIILRSYKYKFK